MKYKGYTAVVELDEEQGILFGRVVGLRDVVTFQAESVPQAIEEFHASVDSYLELCRSRNENPEKPYSGHFVVRIDPELHRQISIWAQVKSVSINSLVESFIRSACWRSSGTPTTIPPTRIDELIAMGEEVRKGLENMADVDPGVETGGIYFGEPGGRYLTFRPHAGSPRQRRKAVRGPRPRVIHIRRRHVRQRQRDGSPRHRSGDSRGSDVHENSELRRHRRSSAGSADPGKEQPRAGVRPEVISDGHVCFV